MTLFELEEIVSKEIGYTMITNGGVLQRSYRGSDDEIIRICYEVMKEAYSEHTNNTH